MNIELHIKELILHGFAPHDRHLIREAVERELTHLLAEQGVPPSLAQGGEISVLGSGNFEVVPGSKIDAIGSQMAQAIYGGIKK